MTTIAMYPNNDTLGERLQAVLKKGRWMALETNTFLMVLVAAIFVMGVVIWVMLKKAG